MRTQPFTPEVNARLETFLRAKQLSRAEFWVLEELGITCQMPEELLIRRCAEQTQRYDGAWRLEKQELAEAFSSLVARGLAQRIDQPGVEQIALYLKNAPFAFGPTYGLPDIGTVDLTLSGGALSRQLQQEVFGFDDRNSGTGALLEVDETHYEIYATSRERAAEGFYDAFFPAEWLTVIRSSDIEEIDAWRDRWWRTFPSGWRITAAVRSTPPEEE